MACICIGPVSSGKTLLLKRLQGAEVDDSTSTVETVGSNIVQIPKKLNPNEGSSNPSNTTRRDDKDFIGVREIGGSMSPLWPSYYSTYKPVIYVIDSSNLFQVSISTVHLMEILTHEKLVRCRILIVLAKRETIDDKKLNLLKFMMRLDNIINQVKVSKRVTLLEASAIDGDEIEEIRKWIVENCAFSARLCQIETGEPLKLN